MGKKEQLAISIIAGILIFALGIGLGIIYQAQNKAQIKKNEAVKSLSSKTISSLTAYGKVSKIEGKNITLSSLGDNLAVPMADSAKVYSFNDNSGNNSAPQKAVSFEDIKVGDSVNITMKLLQDGQMQGLMVVILPPAAQ